MNNKKLGISLLTAISLMLPSLSAIAYQPDAPYIALEKKNKVKWQQQNQEIKNKLQALHTKFGKKPNIIFILADDVGWGEVGTLLGGKLRGEPTPNLNTMAKQGMEFLSHYSEPSCTPSRIALMTGRYPVRTGLTAVLWPGQTEGLSPEEVTIAELLSNAGYHTAMWGKWHLGELEEHAPENQGFDQSYYSLYNGAAWAWPDMQAFYEKNVVPGVGFFYDYPGNEAYKEQYGITIEGLFKGKKGEKRQEVEKIDSANMVKFEEESANQIVEYIQEKAKADKPFFIYWATFANQVAGSPPKDRFKPNVDSRNNQAAQIFQHDASVGRILQTLEDSNIAENTLVIWISDNGPMYAFWPTTGYSWLRGGKGDIYEGGIRTPGFAWWPGMISPEQKPDDIISITDFFTTAASLAGVQEAIPNDRITDGVDQSALLLMGNGNSRRNYMFHYSGKHIGAARMGDYKTVKANEGHGGLPGLQFYNIIRDPRETHGSMYNYLWLIAPFQNLIKEHIHMLEKFPHRILPKEQDVPDEAELTSHD